MKKLVVLFVTFLLMLLVVACGSSEETGSSTSAEPSAESTSEDSPEEVEAEGEPKDNETYTINIHNGLSDTSSLHKGLEKFKEVVEEKSEGQLQIEIFSNSSLYASDREAIEAVQAGNLEMAVPATAPMAGFSNQFMVLDMLFLFDNAEVASTALDGELGQRLLETLPPIGMRGLGWGQAGMRQLTNNRGPIETPEDMQGLKMRTMENPVHLDSFSAFGADPQPFAFGELYSALQQNVFNAQENPFNIIELGHFYEVQDYLTISNHVYTAEILLINDDFYNGLPDHLKVILDEAGVVFTDYQRPLAVEEVEESLANLADHMEINELSFEQKQEFIELLAPVYEKYEDQLGDLIELALSYNN